MLLRYGIAGCRYLNIPSDLVNMERWGVRERVCAAELFIRTGSITETQRGFHHEQNQQEAPSPMQSVNG